MNNGWLSIDLRTVKPPSFAACFPTNWPLTFAFLTLMAQPTLAQASSGSTGNIGTFIQMPANQLLVLRAGIPPVRGEKVVYWREKAFAGRVAPPPIVPVHAGFERAAEPDSEPPAPIPPGKPSVRDTLTLDLVIPALEAAGLEPLPEHGASDEAVEAWVERFIDASAKPALQEVDHAR